MKNRHLILALLLFFGMQSRAMEDLIQKVRTSPNISPQEKAELECVGSFLDEFYKDCGRYPTTEEGLKALVIKPKKLDCKEWGVPPGVSGKPYVRFLPPDAENWTYTALVDTQSYELRPKHKRVKNSSAKAEEFLKLCPPHPKPSR